MQRSREPTGSDDAGRANLRLVGDEQSGTGYADWDDCYRDNVGRVHRMLYAKVGNRADAEDLTAEVFLAAWDRCASTSPGPRFVPTWATTARSALAGFWRRRAAVEVTCDHRRSDLTSLVDDDPVDEDRPRPPRSRAGAVCRTAIGGSWSYGSWTVAR